MELFVTASRELQHKMIGAKAIKKRHEIAPEAPQHRLTTIVAEADMHRFFVQNAIERVIDGLRGPSFVLWVPCNRCLVQLDDVGLDEFQLLAQYIRDGHGKVWQI